MNTCPRCIRGVQSSCLYCEECGTKVDIVGSTSSDRKVNHLKEWLAYLQRKDASTLKDEKIERRKKGSVK